MSSKAHLDKRGVVSQQPPSKSLWPKAKKTSTESDIVRDAGADEYCQRPRDSMGRRGASSLTIVASWYPGGVSLEARGDKKSERMADVSVLGYGTPGKRGHDRLRNALWRYEGIDLFGQSRAFARDWSDQVDTATGMDGPS